MTRFTFRLGSTTIQFSSTGLIVGGAIVCAVLLMSLYVNTLRVAVQRGETLRETQRAGITHESSLPASKKVLALAR